MPPVALKMDVTDSLHWWRLDRARALRGPGLRVGDLGLDGRAHHARYHPHWQRQGYGWIYLLAGHGFFESSASGRQELAPGDLAVCLPEHWHDYGPLPGERWVEVFCFVDGPLPEALRAHDELPIAPVLDAGLDDPIRSGFLALVDAGRRADGAACATAWYALATRLADRPARDPAPRRERHAEKLQAIAERIGADPGHPWSFHQLAEHSGLGYEAFRKAFTRRYRMAPHAFLERERMHRACRLLWLGQRVHETASAVGYDDPYHFSRRFKRVIGQSPRDFLRSLAAP